MAWWDQQVADWCCQKHLISDLCTWGRVEILHNQRGVSPMVISSHLPYWECKYSTSRILWAIWESTSVENGIVRHTSGRQMQSDTTPIYPIHLGRVLKHYKSTWCLSLQHINQFSLLRRSLSQISQSFGSILIVQPYGKWHAETHKWMINTVRSTSHLASCNLERLWTTS